MVNETLYATRGYTDIIRWIDPTINIDAYTIQRVLSVGSDTTIAGDVVMGAGESQGYVNQAVTSHESFLGVVRQPTTPGEDYDLDDVIVDGETVNILRPTGGRTIISVILGSDTATPAFEEGDYVALDIKAVAGQVCGWVYADTADSTDTLAEVIGKFTAPVTASATDYQVIDIYY